LNQQLEELYSHECCEHTTEFENLVDLSDIIDEMVREVYKLQGTDGTINQAVTKYIADKLWNAVAKNYGINTADVEYDTPDYHMLESLKLNVWQFSSAKNYSQLRELSDALLDEHGNLKTFEQFKEAAKVINDKYMKTWLKTEWDLAVAGGQMAGKWVSIQRDASIFPFLQFDVVLDKQTTEICRPLADIIVPVGHPILNKYYPPNHFNCRTTVRQLRSGKVTPDHKLPSLEIPEMFQTNLAQQGLIFPEDHPYFIGIPDSVKNQYKG